MKQHYFALTATWLLSRLWVFFLLWALPFIPYDVELYEGWSKVFLSGSFPTKDVLWQYPDGIAFVVLIPQLSPFGYLPSFVFLALFIDFILFLILLRWQRNSEGSVWGLWLWASAGFWVGPTLLTRLDIFVSLAAVLALVSRRTWVQAVFAGIGFSLKLWPILMIFNASRGRLMRWLIVFASSVLAIFAIARIVFLSGDSFLFNQTDRGLHGESVAALPYLLFPGLLNSSGLIEQSGTLEVTGSGTALVGLVVTLLGLVSVGVLFILHVRNRLPGVLPTDSVFIALLITTVFGRVFSPQFYVWLAAVGAVALTSRSSQLKAPMMLIVASSIIAQYIYPLNMGWGDLESDAVAAQALRIALICTALIWALIRIRGEAKKNLLKEGRLVP